MSLNMLRLTRHYATKPNYLKTVLGTSTKVLSPSELLTQGDMRFITPTMFSHPKFTDEECENIDYAHRVPQTLSDKTLWRMIQVIRGSFDFATGYRKPPINAPVTYSDGTRYQMTEGKWLTRAIFLELIAGVPGSVAAFIRHLHSLRMLKRDMAWIETLLDEAYNERMHLLTFTKLGRPSWLTRSIIYIGQGIFTNMFFFSYLANPKWCHRFVGYLEEEAVSTYTHLIEELEVPGRLPNFEKVKIPGIAVQYWWELTEESSFKDLVYRIRADEAKHREVNHTLANLKQNSDRNPFAMKVGDGPQPELGLKEYKPTGWEREDLKL